MIKIGFYYIFFIILIFSGSAGNAEEKERFDKVKNLNVKYLPTKNKIKVSWKEVTGADKYKVKVNDLDGVLIKKKGTSKTKKKVKANKLNEGQTYKVKVKVKKTLDKKASKFKKTNYTHITSSSTDSVKGTIQTGAVLISYQKAMI